MKLFINYSFVIIQWKYLYIKLINPLSNIVYEVPEDNKIIKELAEIYKNNMNVPADDFDEDDDSNEQPTISHKEALKSLETVHAFLLQ